MHLNQTKAAEEAGYSKRRARQAGSDLMQLPEIQARIQQLLDARAERTAIEADDVIKRFWAIATANPNDLVEHRRTCCRHCYGLNYDHQRTQRERDRDLLYAQLTWEKRLEPNPNDVFAFNEQGGLGWDPRKDPNPACPECFGEGTPSTFFKDTRKLSPAALALYAGVKETKEGLELKMHSQADALTNVARHLGLFKDTIELEAGESLEAILAKSWGPSAPGGHA